MTIAGDIKTISGEGMPVRRHMHKGNLYVKMNIVFPPNNWIESDKFRLIEKLLPTRKPIGDLTGIVDEVSLTETDMRDKERRQHAARHAEDSDDDGHHGHGQGGVQCAQQ